MTTAQSRARTKTSSERRPHPKRLFYRINEVAEIAGLKPYVLRYWETQFKELSPEKDKNDQRRYRQSDVEMVLKICDLLYKQKFTIAGARQRIRDERSSRPASRRAAPRRSDLQSIRAELHKLMNQLSA